MIQRRHILRYVRALAKEFAPERVVLFGSYARGRATADSDVDLLVVMDHGKRKNVEQAIAIDRRIASSFPLDLLVRRPAEIRRRLALNDIFLQDIFREGRVLYERTPASMLSAHPRCSSAGLLDS